MLIRQFSCSKIQILGQNPSFGSADHNKINKLYKHVPPPTHTHTCKSVAKINLIFIVRKEEKVFEQLSLTVKLS